MKHKIVCPFSICIVLMILNHSFIVQAYEDNTEIQSDLLDEFDFQDLNQCIQKLLPASSYTFESLFQDIRSGNYDHLGEHIKKTLYHQFFYELRYQRQTFIRIILIALMAAIFTNFSNAFGDKQIAAICFYILYLLLFALCLNSFQISIQSVESEIEHLTEFMEILCPTYLLSVAIAVGSNTSIVFYNILLFMIYLVDVLILSIVVPAIHIYIMVVMMNFLSEEEMFTQLAELIEKGIIWVLKGLISIMIGIGVVERLLSPALDNLRRSAITKGAEALPAVGDALNGSVQILLGSAVVIKNSIGITGMIFCIVIMIVPFLKLLFVVMMFKLSSAIVQPISDKRITGCLAGVSKGGELLMRVLYTVSLLFLITIALIASTNHV